MNKHDWLLSVLDDLETYAQENDLPTLSKELLKTKLTAQVEIVCKVQDRLPSMEPMTNSDLVH
jgi:hypothetical protein